MQSLRSIFTLILAIQTFLATAAYGQQATEAVSGTSVPVSSKLLASVQPGDVALGQPVSVKRLDYPKKALSQHIQGEILLRLFVGKDGNVQNVSVISGEPLLSKSAVKAVRGWRFVPYFTDEKPVAASTVASVNFEISEDGKPHVSADSLSPKSNSPVSVVKRSDGVSPPKILYSAYPEYSQQAIQDKFEGTCVLELVVGPDGRPYNIHVTRVLGEGLDEKAIDAVRQWRFVPGKTEDGKPVAVTISVQVAFRIP